MDISSLLLTPSFNYTVQMVQSDSLSAMSQKRVFVSLAVQPSAVYGLLVPRGFVITHNDAPQSVGLIWTSDQLVAETST
jgi:hypothetical protein